MLLDEYTQQYDYKRQYVFFHSTQSFLEYVIKFYRVFQLQSLRAVLQTTR